MSFGFPESTVLLSKTSKKRKRNQHLYNGGTKDYTEEDQAQEHRKNLYPAFVRWLSGKKNTTFFKEISPETCLKS